MTAPTGPPPQAQMMQLISGKLVSRALGVVAELRIADHVAEGPRNCAELAATTDSNPDALFRVLRMLAGLDVFRLHPDRRVENTPLSDTLRSDTAGSVRDYARWLGTDFHYRAVSGLDYSVRTGQPSMAKDAPDGDVFTILASDGVAQSTFNDAMTGLSLADGEAIVGAYDFASYSRITDVAGGHGALAQRIATAAPEAQVTVFDLPHVVDGTARRLSSLPEGSRIGTIAGSFFEAVPGPTDLCVMKHIIHDWDDEKAATILRNCRRALAPGGCVVLCEMLVTDGPEGLPALILDIEMLLGPGGRERTREEYASLFAEAGLHLDRIIPTHGSVSLLEARPA